MTMVIDLWVKRVKITSENDKTAIAKVSIWDTVGQERF